MLTTRTTATLVFSSTGFCRQTTGLRLRRKAGLVGFENNILLVDIYKASDMLDRFGSSTISLHKCRGRRPMLSFVEKEKVRQSAIYFSPKNESAGETSASEEPRLQLM